MNIRPSLRQIEAFLAVAQAGSFSAAARATGSTQPALSQSVRDLEALLGLPLFARTTRRVDLTVEGEALRESLSAGLGVIDDAILRARDTAQLKSGHLRIAAPPLLAGTVLPPLIAGFLKSYPGLSFELSDVVSSDIPRRVRAGFVDIGIGTFAPTEEGLDRRIMLTDVMSLICPVSHPLAGKAAHWSVLAGQSLIGLSRDSSLRRLADAGLHAVGVEARLVMEVQHVSTALAMVEAGLGVAVFPSYTVRGREARLSCQPLQGPRLTRDIALISASGLGFRPASLAFARHLVAGFTPAYRASSRQPAGPDAVDPIRT